MNESPTSPRRASLWLGVVAAMVLIVAWFAYARLKADSREQAHRIQFLEQEIKAKDEELARLADEVRRLTEQLDRWRPASANKSAQAASQPDSAQEQPPMALALHEWFMFFPSKYPDGDWEPRNLANEDCWFEAVDGVKIHAWYCPHEKPRAAILVSPGNAGNLSYWDDLLRYLHDKLQVSALIYDYRGYGRSTGKPTIGGILLDARAARAELAKRANIDPSQVTLFGRSLGGAVSIDLAAELGARGLIVESTFSTFRDVAGNHYPPALVKMLVPDALNSLNKITKYHGPLLLSHGDADRVVPLAQGKQLFAAANEPKQFFVIPGGDHNDPQPAEYYRALEKFIDDLPSW